MNRALRLLILAALVQACTFVPEKFDTEISAGYAAAWNAADDLQDACGVRDQEVVAQSRLLRVALHVAKYQEFYGNAADVEAGKALVKAVVDFAPGIGDTYCKEHSLNVKARVEREAKVLKGRPRR